MNIEELETLKELSEQTYFGDLPFSYYADLIGKLLTAYEKEKETSHYIQSQLDIANAKLVEEKEKNKKAIDFINERKKTVNKDMAEGTRLQVGTFMWQVDELLEILKEE